MSTVVLPTAIERIAADLHEACGHSAGNAAGIAITSIRAIAKGRVPVKGVARNDARACMSALAEAKLTVGLRDHAVRRLETVEARSGLMEPDEMKVIVERARHRRALSEGLLLALNSKGVAAERAAKSAVKLVGDGLTVKETAEALAEQAEADRLIVEMFAQAVGSRGRAPAAAPPTQPPPSAVPASSMGMEFERLHPRNRLGEWIEKGEGMQGPPSERVEMLQRRMAQLGFRTVPDGRFGPVTQAAVQAFQRKYGLEANGRVDAQTIEALRNPPPRTAADVEAEMAAQAKGKTDKAGGTASAGSTAADSRSDAGSASRSASSHSERENTSASLDLDLRDPAAVKAFQEEHGLKPTGDVDQATRAVISAIEGERGRAEGDKSAVERGGGSPEQKAKTKGETATRAAGDNMREGDGLKGKPDPDVKEAQGMLAALGFDLGDGGADGRFGPATRAAVMSLQRKYGLEVDGVIGPATLRLLERLKRRRAEMSKDKKAQAETDILGAASDRDGGEVVDEASYTGNAIVAGNVVGTRVAYGGIVPFLTAAAGEIPAKKEPPNLHQAPGWKKCANCIWFHFQHECLYYDWRVDETQVCDSHRTVTPEVEEMAEVSEALAYDAWESLREAELANDTMGIVRARARLTTLDEAVLTASARKNLPDTAFVFPKEKRYPIHDLAHARNALARSSGKPEEATVKAAVYKRYPQLKPSAGD